MDFYYICIQYTVDVHWYYFILLISVYGLVEILQ
jgi:hypothetical protein